jgi:hypothetical protein
MRINVLLPRCFRFLPWAVLSLGTMSFARAADSPKTEEDSRREAAIADFTRKMKEANYPALFEKAAQEFKVPADVLKGVSFAETRWDHLTWPPGETVSPETGMPRPYGIMSLWDNQFFGHSLLEAAKLIGKDPEELKQDPLQNMRGAAALLRKTYDENPKPEATTEADIESWRYAIRKYCGIPEPDLNAQHALNVYVFMSEGYHQFGIEWPARPVNLEPIREETGRIVSEERKTKEARMAANSNSQDEPAYQRRIEPSKDKAVAPLGAATAAPSQRESLPAKRNLWWIILALLAITMGGLIVYRNRAGKK